MKLQILLFIFYFILVKKIIIKMMSKKILNQIQKKEFISKQNFQKKL